MKTKGHAIQFFIVDSFLVDMQLSPISYCLFICLEIIFVTKLQDNM